MGFDSLTARRTEQIQANPLRGMGVFEEPNRRNPLFHRPANPDNPQRQKALVEGQSTRKKEHRIDWTLICECGYEIGYMLSKWAPAANYCPMCGMKFT